MEDKKKRAENREKKADPAPLSVSTPTSPQMGLDTAREHRLLDHRNLGGEEEEATGSETRAERVKVYFTPESWKGVKTVFKCATCGTFRDERDAMIEHVLLHFPKGEQERVFEELMKE